MRFAEISTSFPEISASTRRQILALKPVFEAAKGIGGNDAVKQRILIMNATYMTTAGGMSISDYLALLKECEQAGDYTALGLQFYGAIQVKVQAQIAESDRPEHGGTTADPDKAQLRNSLREYQGSVDGLNRATANRRNNSMNTIGMPPPHLQPDWIVAMSQQKLGAAQLLEMVESSESMSPANSDAVIESIRKTEKDELVEKFDPQPV